MPGKEIRLVARVISGDEPQAFAELVKMHQSRIRAFLLRLTRGDGALSDDLAQEVFLTAYKKIKSFQGTGSFSAWLHKIAYTAFLQNLRQAAARTRREDAWDQLQIRHTHIREVRLDVEKALSKLKLEERSALTLCFSHGYTHMEACAIMGMPLGTLKSHIARGKEKLAAELKHFRKDKR